MFEIPLNRINDFFTFPTRTVADIITLIIIIICIFLAFKSSLQIAGLLGLFLLLMGVLELIGVSSTFNIVTLITESF